MTEYGFISIEYDLPDAPKKTRQKMDGKTVIELMLVTAVIGIAAFGFNKFSDLYVYLIKKTPLVDYILTSEAMYNIVQAFFSIFAIMIPFSIAWLILKLIRRKDLSIPFNAPKSGSLTVAFVFFAFLTVVVSNVLVSLAALGMEAVGFEFDIAEMPDPKSFAGYLWQVFSVALVPAFVEEFAIRGVMLQSLRKYGDIFAIIVSAVFFGLMHGNVMQAPFAFLLGMVISWAVIQTGSIWTGIIIHLLNNFYATSLTALNVVASSGLYIAIVATINIVGALLGLLAIVWIVDKKRHELHIENKYRWEPYVFAVLSIPFTASLIYLAKICLETVHYVGVG